MKLPVESLLLVLGFFGRGFLDRQTLGRLLVVNRRLSRIVNRHRKTLYLPEIPVPPRLSTSLKLIALLAVVSLLLLPIGTVYARRSTQSHLRAAGIVPATVDVEESALTSFEFHWILWTDLLLALHVSANAGQLLGMDRTIADKYMGTTWGPRRGKMLRMHAKLRKGVIVATIAVFTIVVLGGSLALYGMTFQSFPAVNNLFVPLLVIPHGLILMSFCVSCKVMMLPGSRYL